MNTAIAQGKDHDNVAKATGLSLAKSQSKENQKVGTTIGMPLYLQRHHAQFLALVQRQCEGCEDQPETQEEEQVPAPIQAKLMVGAVDDPLEREADEVADEVMRMPVPVVGHNRSAARTQSLKYQDEVQRQPLEEGKERRLQRQSESASVLTLSPGVENEIQSLPGSGQPLPDSVRHFMEPRFDADFSTVRIHTDHHAHDLARSVDAQAFTVGRDVVFGAGFYAPESNSGKHLVAHELAHTMQQGEYRLQRARTHAKDRIAVTASPTEHLVIARQVSHGPGGQTVSNEPADLFAQFQTYRAAMKDAEALDVAKKFMACAAGEDYIDRGEELLIWFLDHGEKELALKVLEHTRMSVYDKFIQNQPTMWAYLIPSAAIPGGGATRLYERGKRAAENNDHALATSLLVAAAQFAEMVLHDESLKHRKWADAQDPAEGAPKDEVGRMIAAWLFGIQDPIDLLRKILDVYPQLQRQAIAANDDAAAAAHETRSKELLVELKKEQLPEGIAVTMMTSLGSNVRKEVGYKLYGKGDWGSPEVVTPLPGKPTIDELGTNPPFVDNITDLLGAIGEQEQLEASLHAYPEIQKAFPTGKIAFNDTAARLKVWAAMYAEYQKQSGDAFTQLLALIQRYLKAFTTHSEYNVRDFGSSYLDSTLPVDFADRTVRDCGVYALTVAYEVYRTARDATPKLPVDFMLYSFLEHVALLIYDRNNDQFHIVNNDEIRGPTKGKATGPEAQKEMGSIYGATMGRGMLIAPTVPIKLGSTAVAEANFKHDAWLGFQASQAWGLSSGASRQQTYAEYYQDMKTFDKDATELQLGLDRLSKNVQHLASDSDRKLFLDEKLPVIVGRFATLRNLFNKYLHPQPSSPQQLVADPRSPAAAILTQSMQQSSYLEFFKSGTTPGDPLTRLGKAILLHQRLRGNVNITPAEQSYLKWLRQTPVYDQKLNDYYKAGCPLTF